MEEKPKSILYSEIKLYISVSFCFKDTFEQSQEKNIIVEMDLSI